MTKSRETCATAPADRYARCVDVVWRVGPDRVLLRRIGVAPEHAAMDLIGDVAYVWVALDTPATKIELADRLADAGVAVADLTADLGHLVGHSLITTIPDASEPT